MKSNKGKRRAIIISIVILLILIALISLYIFTDILKSNKQLFLEYMSKNAEIATFFQDEDLTEYFEKQGTISYTNKGEITEKLQDTAGILITQAETQNLNQFKITFEGQVDSHNQKVEQKYALQYSDEVSFPIEYKQTGTYYGIKSEDVVNKYITVENNNLKELAKLFGVEDTSAIPDRIDFNTPILFTEQELRQLLQTYMHQISQNISNEDITVDKKEKETVYQLVLTERELINIAVILCESLKIDGTIIEKISAYTTTEEYTKQINNIINKLNEQEVSDENAVQIKLYVSNRNLDKTEIILNGKIATLEVSDEEVVFNIEAENPVNITLNKQKAADKIQFDLTATAKNNKQEETKITASYLFNGIQSLETLQEKGQLKVELMGDVANITSQETSSAEEAQRKITAIYSYQNEKKFTPSVVIEELTEENSQILNTATQEYVDDLNKQVKERVLSINQQQMQTLGYTRNPLEYFAPWLLQNANATVETTEETVQQEQQNTEPTENVEMQNQENQEPSEEEKERKINELTGKLITYERENVTGEEIKTILDIIKEYNTLVEESKKIKISVNNTEVPDSSFDHVKPQVEGIQSAKVVLEKDSATAQITKVTVTQNE